MRSLLFAMLMVLAMAGMAFAQDGAEAESQAMAEAEDAQLVDQEGEMEDYPMPVAGSISWIEIPSTNSAESAEFYSSVFGWETMEDENAGMTFWIDTAGNNGGFSEQSTPAAPNSGVVIYITVDNIADALAAVEGAGGTAVLPLMELPEGWGSIAVFADPHGNSVGLWSAT